jgi:hypothetical protein
VRDQPDGAVLERAEERGAEQGVAQVDGLGAGGRRQHRGGLVHRLAQADPGHDRAGEGATEQADER